MSNCFKNVQGFGIGLGLLILGLQTGAAQTPNPSDTTYVRFAVTYGSTTGNIDVQLLSTEAPLNVANFMGYVTAGTYNNSLIHRNTLAETPAVIQGGEFNFVSNTISALVGANAPTVTGEHGANGFSNVRGTLAMALSNGPNSATDSWFFNLVDNSSVLDNTSDGGPFTVFGVVANSSSLAVMDAISAIPVFAYSSPFDTLPLVNFTEAQYEASLSGASIPLADFVYVTSITTLTTTDFATWQTAFRNDPNAATDQAPAATPQGDRTANLLKYFCGVTADADMSAKDRAKLPTASQTKISGQEYLTLTYHERPNLVGVFMTVQASTDLQTWAEASATPTQTGTDSDGDAIMQVQVPAASTGAEFLRLSLTQ